MAKKKGIQTLVLADYWDPPDGIEVRLDVGEPEICLATTYEFDATFFETILLPRFLRLRFDYTEKESIFLLEREQALYTTQVMVLVDRAKYDPGQSTQRYQQLPVYVPGGKQHAKISLLVWQHCVRLLVASANLTKSGYRSNREIFSAIDFFNDATSAPAKLLKDALDFAERLCAFADPEHPVTVNALKAIQEVRNKIARWRDMPADFSSREKPRATLVYGHPAHPNFPAASPLDQLLKLWNNRRADSVWIVTPFAGTTSPGEDPVLKKIVTLPRRQNAQVILAIPQEEFHKEQKKHAVPIAKDFGQSYQELFEKRGLVLPIPRLVENKDEKPRELHAKAIIVQNSEHTLFFCGSSNFTPHGMGVQAFNCECNVAFEDATMEFRSGKALASRIELPLGWEKAVSCDRIIWKASIDTTTIVDDNVGLLAPLFFGLATYSQNTGILRLQLYFNSNQPLKFEIYIEDADNSPPIFTQENLDPHKNYLECILDEKRRSKRITALKCIWLDSDGLRHEGWIPVQVADPTEDLLPPEKLRHLSHSTIIDYLTKGKSFLNLAEEEEEKLPHNKTKPIPLELDPLRLVDTSQYLLYKVRRFGKALAALSDRIAEAKSSVRAIRYLLLYYPFGFAKLADSLAKTESSNATLPSPQQQDEMSYRLFALAELLLAFAYLSQYLYEGMENVDHESFLDTRDKVRETIEKNLALVQSEATAQNINILAGLQPYIESCRQEARRILEK